MSSQVPIYLLIVILTSTREVCRYIFIMSFLSTQVVDVEYHDVLYHLCIICSLIYSNITIIVFTIISLHQCRYIVCMYFSFKCRYSFNLGIKDFQVWVSIILVHFVYCFLITYEFSFLVCVSSWF
uniref:Uncharacterized protein n=1 Tax=Cacopsylla melanoneura TaxID=428564 RepID=A0A8D9ACA5_9HEMI